MTWPWRWFGRGPAKTQPAAPEPPARILDLVKAGARVKYTAGAFGDYDQDKALAGRQRALRRDAAARRVADGVGRRPAEVRSIDRGERGA